MFPAVMVASFVSVFIGEMFFGDGPLCVVCGTGEESVDDGYTCEL